MYGFLPQSRKLKQTAGNMYQISRKPGDHTLTGNDHGNPLTAKLTFDRCNRCNTRCKAGRKQEGLLLKVVSELPAGEAVEPNNMDSVATTLSFAMKPVIRAVEIRQSPNQAV